MVTPTLFYIFSERHSLSNAQSLSLLLIPLFVLQYIYYLQAGVPVGFTDPHRHIFTYWNLFTDTGKILFENVQSISLNFVGLYVLFRFLSLVSELGYCYTCRGHSAIPQYTDYPGGLSGCCQAP